MKKIITIVLFLALIVSLAAWYVKTMKTGAEATDSYIQDNKAQINESKKAMESINQSVEDSKKAADALLGK